MTFKVLVTCPPMLKQIKKFDTVFKSFNIEYTAPTIIQTMSIDDLLNEVPKHDGWIIGDDPATYEVFRAGKEGNLKAAVKWGIGTDNVDFEACTKLGIPITNTPGMFGNEVADIAMCYVLGLAREAFYVDREVRKGSWPKPCGISLLNKNIGIIGLGDIGKNIAKRAHAHGLNVIGWDPSAGTLPGYIQLARLWPEKLDECDFIVFACALNDQTHHMFNDSILQYLKHDVKIINVSRGPLINELSLIKAIDAGIVKSAALDVFEEEPPSMSNKILSNDKCIFGSHNGSNTIDAVERASNHAIEIIYNMLK